ncbi:hypothetical protein DRN45_02705 [Thermococci archaeon]|nr:MAG: hypothetical protein DRN45_02705 [Thermococci archaeon]
MIREWRSHPRKMKKLYSKRSRIEAIFWSMKSRLGDIVRCRTPWTILIEFWCKNSKLCFELADSVFTTVS